MPDNVLLDMVLYVATIAAIGLPAVLLKASFNLPAEVVRKMYHLVITLSIFPLVHLFSAWYLAVLAALLFALVVYPLLMLLENSPFYQRIATEREGGEFKNSLIIVQVSLGLLLFLVWGEWRFVAVVAVLAWGFGDAAAALVGKYLGRCPIAHPRIAGTKTMEGTQAMFVTAGLAIFLTLLLYAHQPWPVSLVVALLVAPICAIVELFSNGVMDILTVPFSAALTLVPLLYLFSLVGG